MSSDRGALLQKLKLGGAIVAAVLALILVVQNREAVEVYVLFGKFSIPNAILLLLTYTFGVVSGLLLSWWRSHRRS